MWHSPRSAVNKFWWRVKLYYPPTPLLLWFPTFCKSTFIPRQTIITINMELRRLLIVISRFLAAPISSPAGLPLVDESRNLWKETLLGVVIEGAKHILSNEKGRQWETWKYRGDKAKQDLFPEPNPSNRCPFHLWRHGEIVNVWISEADLSTGKRFAVGRTEPLQNTESISITKELLRDHWRLCNGAAMS